MVPFSSCKVLRIRVRLVDAQIGCLSFVQIVTKEIPKECAGSPASRYQDLGQRRSMAKEIRRHASSEEVPRELLDLREAYFCGDLADLVSGVDEVKILEQRVLI